MTTEKNNIKVNLIPTNKLSDYQRAVRKSVNLQPIYFDQVVNYINNRIEDVELRDRVMAVAKKYPHSALNRFVSNFERITTECRRILSESKCDEAEKIVVPPKKQITTDDLMSIQSQLDEEWQNEISQKPVENNDETSSNDIVEIN
jgi:hypothetical protein